MFTFSEVLLSSRVVFMSTAIFSVAGLFVNLSRVMMIMLFIINVDRLRLTTFVELSLLLCLIVISHKVTTIWALFDLFFLPFFLKKYASPKIYKCFLYAILSGCAVVILFHYMGVLPEIIYYRRNMRVRYSFGFSNPNSFSRYVMLSDILFILLRKDKLKYWHIGVIFASALFVYQFPNTITVAAMIVLMSLVLLINKLLDGKLINFWACRAGIVLVIPCMIAVFAFLMVYYRSQPGMLYRIDNTIQARFIMGFRGIDDYGIHLFGNNISFVSSSSAGTLAQGEYFVIDSLFFYLPVRMGIIITVMFFSFYMWLLVNAVRERRFYCAVALLIVGCYSMFENAMLSSYAFVFSFLMMDNIYTVTEQAKRLWNSIISGKRRRRRFHVKIKR